ncbi:MAG TPA: hypothetical protein VF150_04080 [Thermoanaerobaculia bacterium]
MAAHAPYPRPRAGRLPIAPIALLTLGAALAAGAVVEAQTSPPPDGTQETEGLTAVPVDLSSGAFQAVLPFDEPFLLTGTVPAGVVRIDGEWCPIPEAAGAQLAALLKSARKESRLTACPGSAEAPRPIPAWENPFPAAPGAAAPTFTLFVAERLEVNENYLFSFVTARQLGADELATFQPRVRSALDQTLRSFASEPAPDPSAPLDEVTARKYQALQRAVGQVLATQPLRSGEVAQPEPDTFFDPASVPVPGAPPPPWTREIEELYRIQATRQDPASRLDERTSLLFDALEEVGQGASGTGLAALRGAIAALSAGDRATLDHLLPAPALAALDALAGERGPRLDAVAFGLAALGAAAPGDSAAPPDPTPAQPPPDPWTAADVAPRAANLAATRAALTQALALTRTAEQVDALRSGLGGADLAPLRDALAGAGTAAGLVQNLLARLAAILAERDQALGDLSGFLVRQASTEVPIVATSTGSFSTRAKNHVSMDVGILYSGDAGEVLPYFAANFYLRPVNRAVPLAQVGGFGRRFSIMVGVTYSSIQEEENGRVLRDDLFGSQALVVGAGLRLTDAARVSVGALVYQENDPNPLVDDLSLTADPFFAVSFDWNVRNLLGPLGTAITGGE